MTQGRAPDEESTRGPPTKSTETEKGPLKMTPPWRRTVQAATGHVDQITQLLARANDALDEGWDSGNTQQVDAVLARIQTEAKRGRAALRGSTRWSRVRAYVMAA